MMRRRNDGEISPYSASVVKLHVSFIREKPGVVKELIRLVKYWINKTVRAELGNLKLPASYPMELITIYTWEKAGRPRAFDRLKGLKAVLKVIGNESRDLNHYWTENYSQSVAKDGIKSMDSKDREK